MAKVIQADDLIARLNMAAESSSSAHRSMAEAKSIRNSDGAKSDLYSWPTPEMTIEGQAAGFIAQLLAERDELVGLVRAFRFAAEYLAGLEDGAGDNVHHDDAYSGILSACGSPMALAYDQSFETLSRIQGQGEYTCGGGE